MFSLNEGSSCSHSTLSKSKRKLNFDTDSDLINCGQKSCSRAKKNSVSVEFKGKHTGKDFYDVRKEVNFSFKSDTNNLSKADLYYKKTESLKDPQQDEPIAHRDSYIAETHSFSFLNRSNPNYSQLDLRNVREAFLCESQGTKESSFRGSFKNIKFNKRADDVIEASPFKEDFDKISNASSPDINERKKEDIISEEPSPPRHLPDLGIDTSHLDFKNIEKNFQTSKRKHKTVRNKFSFPDTTPIKKSAESYVGSCEEEIDNIVDSSPDLNTREECAQINEEFTPKKENSCFNVLRKKISNSFQLDFPNSERLSHLKSKPLQNINYNLSKIADSFKTVIQSPTKDLSFKISNDVGNCLDSDNEAKENTSTLKVRNFTNDNKKMKLISEEIKKINDDGLEIGIEHDIVNPRKVFCVDTKLNVPSESPSSEGTFSKINFSARLQENSDKKFIHFQSKVRKNRKDHVYKYKRKNRNEDSLCKIPEKFNKSQNCIIVIKDTVTCSIQPEENHLEENVNNNSNKGGPFLVGEGPFIDNERNCFTSPTDNEIIEDSPMKPTDGFLKKSFASIETNVLIKNNRDHSEEQQFDEKLTSKINSNQTYPEDGCKIVSDVSPHCTPLSKQLIVDDDTPPDFHISTIQECNSQNTLEYIIDKVENVSDSSITENDTFSNCFEDSGNSINEIRSAPAENIEKNEFSEDLKISNEEFSKKRIKKGSLLERAFRITVNMKNECTLFAHEINFGLRSPDEGPYVSDQLRVNQLWKEDGKYFLKCSPLQFGINPDLFSLTLVVTQLPNDICLHSTFVVHFPVNVLFKTQSLETLVFVRNRLKSCKKELSPSAYDEEFVLDCLQSKFEKKIIRSLTSRISKHILDSVVSFFLVSNNVLEVIILRKYIVETESGHILRFIARDLEHEVCLINIKKCNSSDKYIEGHRYELVGFKSYDVSPIDEKMVSLLQYLIYCPLKSNCMYYFQPIVKDWEMRFVGDGEQAEINLSTLLTVKLMACDYKRFRILVEECNVWEDEIRLRDRSLMADEFFILRIEQNLAHKLPTVFLLDGVYYLKGELIFDIFSKISY